MKIAVTGHRPSKLNGYSEEAQNKLLDFAHNILRKQDNSLHDLKLITGMALGWDMAIAKACYIMNIPYICAIPCLNQESVWNKYDQAAYKHLINKASEVIYVSDKPYFNGCMQLRNIFMCDNCDKLLALWDGSSGGTANCVKYAESKEKSVVNVWDDWINYK